LINDAASRCIRRDGNSAIGLAAAAVLLRQCPTLLRKHLICRILESPDAMHPVTVML
jgi:hypothetical protein